MKKYRILSLLLTGCLLFAGCADGNNTDEPDSSYSDRDNDEDKDEDIGNGSLDQYDIQDKYVTLRDTAHTIRNSVITSCSDAIQIGDLGNIEVTGKKSDGKLEFTISGDHTLAADDDYTADYASPDRPALRFAKCFYAGLADFLPDGSSFYVKIDNSKIYGVIYSDDLDNVITGEVDVYKVEDYFDAYEDEKHNPIGVSGNYIPQ